jgi:hypothetical protein
MGNISSGLKTLGSWLKPIRMPVSRREKTTCELLKFAHKRFVQGRIKFSVWTKPCGVLLAAARKLSK